MGETLRILYGSGGLPACVQIPYAEYVRLDGSAAESALLKARVKQLAETLSGQSVSAVLKTAPAPAKPVVPVEPPPPAAVSKPEPPPLQPEAAPVKKTAPAVRPAAAAGQGAAVSVQIPPALLNYVNEQDPSQQAIRMIEACMRRISTAVGRRITVSLHKPYVCLWDFDLWRIFACGEVRAGRLYLSVDLELAANLSDVWTPPSGVFKKPMARVPVDRVTDELIDLLQNAVENQEPAVA